MASCIRLFVAAFVFVLGVLGSGATAHAQLAGLNHILTVPGAMNTGNGIGTYVSCTNGNTSQVTVGVEFYGPSGSYLGGQSSAMAPGATVIYGSTASVGIGEDINLNLANFKGHARVVASVGGKIVCSAYLADATSGLGPLASLPVVKKFVQK